MPALTPARPQDCLTFAHGAAAGSHEARARLFAQYGVQLADMAHPLGSHLWHDLSQARALEGGCAGCVGWKDAARARQRQAAPPTRDPHHGLCLRRAPACPRRAATRCAASSRCTPTPWLISSLSIRLPSHPLQGYHALYNEQLVYVAAFAVGARLVFGDRPKTITYARMLWLPSIGAPPRKALPCPT